MSSPLQAMMVATPKSSAVNLEHHLSDLSKARAMSPLKGMFKYIEGNPNLLNMAGGVPSPAYFPFANIGGDALVNTSFLPDSSSSSPFSWFWSLFGLSQPKEKTFYLTVPKYPKEKDDINLAVALQYGTATGIEALRKFMKEFSTRVYQPPYADFTTLVHAGNTDGWSKAALTLMNPGDCFLTEEWTYPSALAMAAPFGFKPTPIKADAEGMRSDDLEHVLSTWSETERGVRRPHVMYTVPCGQNPTGSNMGSTRKKAIYDICVKYDVIIVEDDPYYFLQEGPYVPKHLRKAPKQSSALSDEETNDLFIKSLAPSYLKYDYQGRVIRLDTFSKTIAPGSRMGWFTCNPMFAERLERQGESTTQAPCGFSQALITQLLTKQWTLDGYLHWLRGLQVEYTARRDALVDLFAEEFHLMEQRGTGMWSDLNVLVAYEKENKTGKAEYADEKKQPILSLVPPQAGMFVWLNINTENLSRLKNIDDPELDTPEKKLFVKLAEAGLLIGPGWFFAADRTDDKLAGPTHFRMSFSNVDHDTMKKAVKTIAGVLKQYSD